MKRSNIPNAATLINSMRSIGYDFESAVADIIDNSISANANNVFMFYSVDNTKNAVLQFFDDGRGMSCEELIEAMRFGSMKDGERDKNDLGRFGLGLKTASISQCKKLTVVSKRDGEINGFCWDLDSLTTTSSWDMIELSSSDIDEIDRIHDFLVKETFTMVMWENFDSIEKNTTFQNSYSDVFLSMIQQTNSHLSLVFHRYIESGVKIFSNGKELKAIDPFLSKHAKTTIRDVQTINEKTSNNKNTKIQIKTFILPYHKDLSAEDIRTIGGESRLDEQGFYIYRNKRLMIHGTWFRLRPKSEMYRNARITVDIPNTLDDLWDIDIKKQKAVIPAKLIAQLKGEVNDATENSKKIHVYKGKKQITGDTIWNRIIDERNGTTKYLVNRDSRTIKVLLDDLSDCDAKTIEKLLTFVELSLPYVAIANSVSERKDINIIDETGSDMILDMALVLYKHHRNTTTKSAKEIVDSICSIEPFQSANIKSKMEELING